MSFDSRDNKSDRSQSFRNYPLYIVNYQLSYRIVLVRQYVGQDLNIGKVRRIITIRICYIGDRNARQYRITDPGLFVGKFDDLFIFNVAVFFDVDGDSAFNYRAQRCFRQEACRC